MTDDSPMNQTPPQQPLPPPPPQHDESSSRHASRTDARPSREADALDAWLNARALSRPSRNGAAAAPATHHDQTGQNGQWSNPSADAPSLPEAASRFHARFAVAEEADAPATPVDAIWEQIMVTSPSLAKPASAPPRLVPSKSSGTTAVRPARHPLLQTVGSHPAATALLVAGVIVAMIVLFRTLDRDQHPPIIDYGPAAFVGDGTATPTATSSPAAAACTYSIMTGGEASALVARVTPRPASAYLPESTPVSSTDAQAALETRRGFDWCERSKEVRNAPYYLQRASLATDGRAAQVVMQATPASLVQQAEENLALTKALSPVLATPDPAVYILVPTDPEVAPYLIPDALGQGAPVHVLLPQDFVTLPDGRIGAPLKTARVGGAGTEGATDYLSAQGVSFITFAQVNGQWLVDTSIWLCTANCDAYYADQEDYIAGLRTWAEQQASPEASPSSSPAATDVWLQPINASECAAPGTSSDPQEEAAYRSRQFVACDAFARPLDSLSEDFLARHPELRNGQFTLTEDDVSRAKAIAPVVADANPEISITGLPAETINRNPVFFLPRNAIALGDGRFGIPMSYASSDSTPPPGSTSTPDAESGTSLFLYIFTMEDGSPRLDDILATCIGNCDAIWAQQELQIGTPLPSDEELATGAATASAVAEAKLPIPSSECAIPTVAADAGTLPARSYIPPLEPTDANATAVNQTARSFIACIEATPSTNADAPPSKVQEVLAPFETDRLRTEMEATGVQPLTADQIAAGKSVSSYLESQGVTSFAERAPQSVVDSSKTVTPRSVGGWSVTPPGFYTVPMPGATIQFPDGRIGVPVLQMVDLWTSKQDQPYASGELWVFAQVGDQWLVDEAIGLCIGDCDSFWQDAASVSEWLQPVGGSECQPVSAETYREYVRPRDYTIVNTPASSGMAVARQSRSRAACAPGPFADRSTADRQFETQRYQDSTDADMPLTDEQIAQAQALSASYEDAGYTVFQRAPEGVDVTDVAIMSGLVVKEGRITFTGIFLPDSAVGLSDGRIAIPTTVLISDDASWNIAMQQPFQTTSLTIWAYVGGTWLIDETLPLCIGDCTSFWQQVEAENLGTPIATPTGTPQGTPTATSTERSGGDNLRPSPTGTPATPASAKASGVLTADRRTLTHTA